MTDFVDGNSSNSAQGEDLSPISCESCRTKKRKCDRRLGIPSGYISSLEKRLAETEVALYGALRDGRNVDPRQSEDLIARLEEHNASQTRASKQAAWARGPVTDNDGQQQWTREISRILDDDAQTAHGIRDAAPVDGSTDRLTPVSVLEARPRAQSAHFAGTESAGKVLDSRTPASSSLREEGMPSPLKRAKTERVANDAARSEVGVMRRSRANNAASFVGSASGIQFVRAVYNAMARASHGNPTSYAQVTDGVPAEDDHLSGPDVRCLWQEHELSSGFNIVPGDMGPSLLNDLFTWSQSYFDQWHPAYPFLEAADVRGWFGQLACGMAISEDDRLARHRMVVVRSIMSIALADRRQADSLGVGRQVPAELVFDSFGTALGSVQSALVEPPSLEALQAVLSVQLFLVTMLRHNAASRLGGLVTRMIFQMGLHRCPARYATFSVTEISLRQRIFYAAYCIDRHICQSLGLPLTLRDDDIDVCRCGSEKHPSETIDQSESSEAYSLPDFLARHGEIVGLVMELRNKSISHRQADREQATLLSTKIAKWSNDVDGFLESEEAYTMTSFHHTVLTVLKGESVIALNRPLLATKVKPEYDSALHSCISASRSIISTLHKYMFRTLARTDDSQTPVMPLAWPSFTWSVWMSAFIALYATLENEMYRTVAARLTDQATEILKHLAARGSIWPSACAAAVRDLSSRLAQPAEGSNGVFPAAAMNGARPSDLSSSSQLGYNNDETLLQPGGLNALADIPLPMPWTTTHVSGNLSNNPFEGYDIPFWMGDDANAPWLSDWD